MMTRDAELIRMRREMAARDTIVDERDSVRDSMMVMERRLVLRHAQPSVQPARPTMITLPVPTVGELYIRYGDSTQRTIRVTPAGAQLLLDSTAVRQSNDATVRELRTQIERLEARLRTPDAAGRESVKDEEIRTLRARLDTLEMQLRMTPTRVAPSNVSPSGVAPSPNVVVFPSSPMSSSLSDGVSAMRIRQVSPYVAGFGQLTLGTQLDLGPVFGVPALRLVPDFAIGLGNDPSVSLAVDGFSVVGHV